MKNIAFICTFILLLCHQSFSQTKHRGSDSLIYLCIINQPGFTFNKHDTPVYDTVYLDILQKFDFKKTDLDKWTGTGTITGWKDFLNQINVDTLREYKLTINNIGNHPYIKRDLKKARDYKHPFLSFSPVIYSSDMSLAVCSLWNYNNPEAGSRLIYLLQFKNGEWRIVKFLTISIS